MTEKLRSGIRVLLTSLCLFCCSFSSHSQILDPDSSEADSSFYDEILQDHSSVEIIRLWDTSQIGIIGVNHRERQTLCLELIDNEHCCFVAPCKGLVTSNFGWRGGRLHAGIDIDLETGDSVYAAFDGIVRQAGWHRGYGYYVILSHFNGLETLYGHLSSLKFSTLQPVKSGQVLGQGGNTGRSRGSHLHFEVRYFGKPMNPKLLIDFEDYSLRTDALNVFHPSTFSWSNFINETQSIVAVMNDSAYQKQEERYEKRRLKAIKEKDKAKRELERKKREKAEKKEKERIKNAKVLYHSVKKGDTLYSMARKYGTTIENICRINKMKSTEILDLGRKIKVK